MRLPDLKLFNHSVPWSGSVKCLGITFDRKLLWNGHINNTASKTLASISELQPFFSAGHSGRAV
jgi:hypothetical protein